MKYKSEIIYKFLEEKNYQTEHGEQEYKMYFDVDMPRILNDFVEYIVQQRLSGLPTDSPKSNKLPIESLSNEQKDIPPEFAKLS